MNYNFAQLNQQPYGAYGYGYAQPQQAQQPMPFNQLLTADEMAKLQKSPEGFTTRLTENEYAMSGCTHKNLNNCIILEQRSNGKHFCPVCKAEFHLLDVNTLDSDIQQICYNMYDLLQSIKTYYGNPPQSMRDFYMMSGFILKIPQLWDIAKNYFNKAVGNTMPMQQIGEQSAFTTLSNIVGPAAITGLVPGMGGYYQQNQTNPLYYQGQQGQPLYQNMPPQQQMMQQGYMVPQPAVIQTPPAPQPQASMWNQPQPIQTPQGPTYGYAYNNNNPIGYVEQQQPQDFTASQTQQAPAPPPAPPMPTPPKNPNVQPVNPSKAQVGKTFAG